MKKVITEKPSFPKFNLNKLLTPHGKERWQVICGDEDHWRLGVYSPEYSQESDILELESHNCPELFILLEGRVSLLLFNEETKGFETLELEQGKPIMVDTWHDGFCPDGPFTGKALVVERDQFETLYKNREDF
jgi:hypothetical protein